MISKYAEQALCGVCTLLQKIALLTLDMSNVLQLCMRRICEFDSFYNLATLNSIIVYIEVMKQAMSRIGATRF